MTAPKVEGVTVSTTERIHVRHNNFGWVDFFIEDVEPRIGTLVIYSDFGCWGYTWCWMGEGEKIKDFLLSAENDYIIRKLLGGLDMDEFDQEATIREWKKEILQERRGNYLTKESARELYDDLSYDGIYDNADSDGILFIERLPPSIQEWKDYPYEDIVTKPSRIYNYLNEIILPILKEVLQQGCCLTK